MNRQKIITLAVAIIAAVALIFLFGTEAGKNLIGRKVPQETTVSKGPEPGTGGHAGHDARPEPEAAQDQTGGETPTIEIPPEKQQMIGVKIAEAKVMPLQKIIRSVGLIQYDEKKLATVNTKFEGWIERLYVNYEGKYVKKGEPLAEIYSPELLASQKEFLSALRWAKSASSTQSSHAGAERGDSVSGLIAKDADTIIDAARQRLRLWDISEGQIRKIEETGNPIRTLTVYSPVNGYVIQKMAVQGMKVMPGEKLFDVVDLSTFWVVADIYENELALIKPGDVAKISLSYFPEKEFSSRIDFIYPAISNTTRTAKVRFEIPNYGGKLKPQMYGNIAVKIDLGRKLAIPEDAVMDTGTRQIVYVDKGEGNFEPREIMTGARSEGFREVTMGLKAGEKVAASATFLIDSEAQLKNVTPLHKH